MFPDYEKDIVAGLMNKDYRIAPAVADGKITRPFNKEDGAALIILSVDANDLKKLATDLTAVLKETKTLYYSLIITPAYASEWRPTNIKLPISAPLPIGSIDQ